MKMALAILAAVAALGAAQDPSSAPQSTVDPASLTNSCPMCIFEGFKFCQPSLSSGSSTCLTSNQVCPGGTTEQTSFSQCSASHYTSSASSNCGTTYTIDSAALTEREVEKFDYAATRQTYTVDGNTACRVQINTNFGAD